MSEELRVEPWHDLFIVVRGRETFYDEENAMITFDTEKAAEEFIVAHDALKESVDD